MGKAREHEEEANKETGNVVNENIQIEAIRLEINADQKTKKKEKMVRQSKIEMGILIGLTFIGIVMFCVSINLLWNSVSNSG